MNNIKDFKKRDFFVLETNLIKIYYLVTKKGENTLEIIDHIGNSEKDSWENFTNFLNNDRDANYQKVDSKEGEEVFYNSFYKTIKDLSDHKKETKNLKNRKNKLLENLEMLRS